MKRSRWPASAVLCALPILLASCGGTTLNPTPTVSALFPSAIPATLVGAPTCTNNPSVTINIQGNNFLTNSVAYWNGATRKTTFNDATGQLAVTILACDIASPGVNYVSVVNPPPGGGPSPVAATFQVTQPSNPAPSVSSLSPASTAAGTLPPGGIVTINGAPAASGSNSPAFISSSQATINGNARATTFVSATELQVQILASDVATAGTLTVSVTNPAPGGGVSSAPFTVTDPPNGANLPQVISISASGGAANGRSSSPAMSATGRYVAFYSEATNLVPSGASGNIFVRDTCIGATTSCTPHTMAVDLAPDGSAPNAAADWKTSISSDGRYIAFSSSATNLIDGSAEGPNLDEQRSNIFVRDMCFGATAASNCSPQTTQVSIGLGGEPSDDASTGASLSSDGRFVAFQSNATNLVTGVDGREGRVFVADLCLGVGTNNCRRETYLVSPDDVTTSDFVEQDVSISASGRYVAFTALPHGNRNQAQIDLRDTCFGKDPVSGCVPSTVTISVDENGNEGTESSFMPSVNADGRYVVFETLAPNLAPGAMTQEGVGRTRVILRDTCIGASAPKSCVPSDSVVPIGAAVSGEKNESFVPSISSSGRYVSFGATLSVPSDPTQHALIRDTCNGTEDPACVPQTAILSANPRGELGNATTLPQVAVSANGRLIAFASDATNLAAPTSGFGDVFLVQMPVATMQH